MLSPACETVEIEKGNEIMEAQAPMYNVRDMKTNKVVGTHSADTGFRPSSADSGLKSHPTSIPNFHKIDRSVDLRGSMDDDEIMKTYVQCLACGEKHPVDKKYVAFENIEEDFQGRDVVTFVCISHPGQLQKSLVYGVR